MKFCVILKRVSAQPRVFLADVLAFAAAVLVFAGAAPVFVHRAGWRHPAPADEYRRDGCGLAPDEMTEKTGKERKK